MEHLKKFQFYGSKSKSICNIRITRSIARTLCISQFPTHSIPFCSNSAYRTSHQPKSSPIKAKTWDNKAKGGCSAGWWGGSRKLFKSFPIRHSNSHITSENITSRQFFRISRTYIAHSRCVYPYLSVSLSFPQNPSSNWTYLHSSIYDLLSFSGHLPLIWTECLISMGL